MKILSIECSAVPCSVAIAENGKILAADFINDKLTHSQTLMPMVVSALKDANLGINDIDGFAVSAGPGSFTGIRIGISAIKGMATPLNKPCVPVSTLETIAQNCKDKNGIICAVMDARCNQVYNALFSVENGIITRLSEDRALLSEELVSELKEKYNDKTIIIAGDGTEVFKIYASQLSNVIITDTENRFQNAIGVSLVAKKEFKNNNTVSSEKLLPVYLRLPQAERELKAKLKN